MRTLGKRAAKSELSSTLTRYLSLVNEVEKHSITENATEKSGTLYLMAIPLIYAAWEGYFRLACALCLKRKCYIGRKAKSYHDQYSVLWLQKEAFYVSFMQKLLNSMTTSAENKPKKLKPSKYNNLIEFTAGMKNWLETPINHLEDFDELVMTYSNVNKEVVTINCTVIGMTPTNIDLTRIDELVGRRNDIAHGGLVNYPSERQAQELINYTKSLLGTFHQEALSWLNNN